MTPDLHTADLDPITLATLFADLEKYTQVLDIFIKGGADAHAGMTHIKLPEAHQLLCERKVRGIQIRYLWDQGEWRDTLMVTPQGVRIIRIQTPTS